MNWRKLGHLFVPEGTRGWMQTHAALPVADALGGDRWHVYFSTRDAQNRARIASFDLKLEGTRAGVSDVSDQPVLDLGPLGAFDDSGVTGGCIASVSGAKYLYYSGWSLGVTVPFYFYIGLAISTDQGRTFERVSPAPVLGRNQQDPYLTASPSVLLDGGIWRMWYISGSGWVIENGRPRHYYNIRYAESPDGVTWPRTGRVVISYDNPSEYAFARPHVVRDGNLYRMWYSFRGDRYRLGYAESSDGIGWVRKDDEVGIGVSETGWDSEMIEYATIFDHGSNRYMLYNGNDYGRSGIGLAVQDGNLE